MMNRRQFAARTGWAGIAAALPARLLAQEEEEPAVGEQPAVEEGTEAEAPPAVEEMALGDPDAPVTLIEYASFTCPHCARFHAEVLPAIRADYVDPGRVRYVYREVYFDRPGLWASMVARCGGAERYFAIADMLYARQAEWTQGTPAEVAGNLRRIGLAAGLSPEALDACLSDGETAQALVANYEANAAADDVRATPSFVLGGETLPNMPLEDLAARLDDALEAAG